MLLRKFDCVGRWNAEPERAARFAGRAMMSLILVGAGLGGSGCHSDHWIKTTQNVEVTRDLPMFTGRRASLILVRVDPDGLAIFHNPDSDGYVTLAVGQSIGYETDQSDERVRERFTVVSSDPVKQTVAVRVEVEKKD